MSALALTGTAAPAAAHQSHLKTAFALPDGFQPEGIAIGGGPWAYFGSRATGDIYRASLATGAGKVISKGPGTQSLGLKLDESGRLYVSGGSAGDARVIDSRTGRVLKSYQLQAVPSFINDVTLAAGSAWFTDSANPALFQVKLGWKSAKKIALTGDIEYQTGNNANGISRSPDGKALIIVQSNTGKLFRTSYSGQTTEIDLGGANVLNGDGIWLRGHTLYVVQNRDNLIAKVALNKSGTRGEVVSRTTGDGFDVPTTIAEYGGRFYLPNARFTTPPTPTTPYSVVSVRIP